MTITGSVVYVVGDVSWDVSSHVSRKSRISNLGPDDDSSRVECGEEYKHACANCRCHLKMSRSGHAYMLVVIVQDAEPASGSLHSCMA